MGRIGEAQRIGSYLQRDSLPYFEVTHDAQVHVEEFWTAELIAFGVSVMSGSGAADHRGSKGARIEELAGRGSAGKAVARRFATELLEGLDEIGGLPRAIRVQVAARADSEG